MCKFTSIRDKKAASDKELERNKIEGPLKTQSLLNPFEDIPVLYYIDVRDMLD